MKKDTVKLQQKEEVVILKMKDEKVHLRINEENFVLKLSGQGPSGTPGATPVSCYKVSTEGLVDTYRLLMSDGTEFFFNVTNGDKGDKGDKGDPGQDGANGGGSAAVIVPEETLVFTPEVEPVTPDLPGLMTPEDKAKLDGIEANANNYSLPTASADTLGGIKVGDNLSIDNGVLSATVSYSHNHDDRYYTETEMDEKLVLKAPLASPALTGTPTAPTAADGTNTTQIATTAFVQSAFKANDAMVFKGTIGSSGATVSALPATHYQGWTYKVATAGTYAGNVCEIGDMIICVTDGTTATDSDWAVIQANVDGSVTGPSSATDAHVAVFNGTSGKVIKDSGFTIGKSVPSNAVFTDTKYTASTTSVGSASAGTAITADDITGWSAGTVPTLGTAIPADDITGWSAGTVPTLGTAIDADDITAWSAGTLPSATVTGENLTINFGSLPSLSYTARSIPNVTSVGTAPSLSYTAKSIPNVTSVGTAPSLTYTEKTIPNISVTPTTVVTGITAS